MSFYGNSQAAVVIAQALLNEKYFTLEEQKLFISRKNIMKKILHRKEIND